MIIVGVDPGPEKSGLATVDFFDGWPTVEAGHYPNEFVADQLTIFSTRVHAIGIEDQENFGSAWGASIKGTAQWTGQFIRILEDLGVDYYLQTAGEIRTHVCRKNNANDSLVKHAVRSRFEPIGGRLGKGTKKNPGPLYGFSGDHVWDATAVCIYLWETKFK